MRIIIRYLCIVLVVGLGMMLSGPVMADDCGVGPPCLGLPDDAPGITCCPVAVPFDGGITLMLAAGGIGMGLRAMRKRKEK